MIWNENAECMGREEKEEMQLALFQQQVKRVYENVPFYKKKFDEAGFHPEDLKTLDDISKIPFTTKADLREAYPFGLFGTLTFGENVLQELLLWLEETKTQKSKIHTDTDYLQEVLESTTVQRQWVQLLYQCLQETLQDN